MVQLQDAALPGDALERVLPSGHLQVCLQADSWVGVGV